MPAPPISPPTDVLIVGGGPSGLALSAELTARGLSVRLVAPHVPQPFPATYGAWLDDWPTWARDCAAQVWSDVRVYTPGLQPLTRPYALMDNARLLDALLKRAGPGLTWTVGTVSTAVQVGERWEVGGAAGEMWSARLVVDTSGHAGLLRSLDFPSGPAFQTAYGVVGRFPRPPVPPGSLSWMDYRPPPGQAGPATFLYAMHLGEDRYFVEETSLIARPALGREGLKARLWARLEAQGTMPTHTESEEWVSFPMNAAAPAPGPVLAFGAAAGMVHPVSGFQVASALRLAPDLAAALVDALSSGKDPVQAGWSVLWPPERRAARELHLLGVRALLALPDDALAEFFRLFFDLPTAEWSAFLAWDTPAPDLTRTMLRLFALAPNRVRWPLVRAALADPAGSAAALGAHFLR